MTLAQASKTLRRNPAISCMLAVDVTIAGILIYNKINFHVADLEYMHLLVTYQFGFLNGRLLALSSRCSSRRCRSITSTRSG